MRWSRWRMFWRRWLGDKLLSRGRQGVSQEKDMRSGTVFPSAIRSPSLHISPLSRSLTTLSKQFKILP